MNHITNWTLLWFALGGYALCWLRRDWRITRLARRCTWLERNWRKAARERDAAQMAAMAVRAENEQLTDELSAPCPYCVPRAAERLEASRARHPSQRRLRSVSADELRRMS